MKKLVALILIMSLSMLGFYYFESDPAVEFLQNLDKNQREKTLLSFEDQSKVEWHFIPASMYPRAGIRLDELSEQQEQLLFKLLKYSLSETGYDKISRIISLEQVLLEITGDSVMRDPKKYHVAFYGDPQEDSLWSWSFEGHHLSLNFTILNDKMSIAPRFLGASPATVESGKRKGERTLQNEDDFGLELINLLSKDQREQAIFQTNPIREIVTMNSSEVGPLNKVGVKYADLNVIEQSLLVKDN